MGTEMSDMTDATASEAPADIAPAEAGDGTVRMNMIQAINPALDVMMDRDPNVNVMGEDVGVFVGLFGAAGADNGACDVGLAQDPGERELAHREARLFRQRLHLLHALEPGLVHPALDCAAHVVGRGARAGRRATRGSPVQGWLASGGVHGGGV